MRRILRLYPALIFAVLGATALSAMEGLSGAGSRAWKALAYVSNYYAWQPGDIMGNLSHTWSLAVEEQFYLIWPLLMLLTRNFRVVIAGAVVALGWRLYMVQAEPNWLRIAFGLGYQRFRSSSWGCNRTSTQRTGVETWCHAEPWTAARSCLRSYYS